MKKSFHHIILWMIIIIIPIIALAEKPDAAHCPAVLNSPSHTHDIDFGTSLPRVTSYNSSTHTFVEDGYKYCKQCTFDEYFTTSPRPESHQKGIEKGTSYKYSLKDATYHYKKTVKSYWCSMHNYGCNAEVSDVTNTTTQKHFCSRHQKYGNKYLHICACGEVKTAVLGSHW